MVQENPYRPCLENISRLRKALQDLMHRNETGNVPDAAEVKAVHAETSKNMKDLARLLELDDFGESPTPVDTTGMEVYDQALTLCMDMTRFSLELARQHGPAYLPPPGH